MTLDDFLALQQFITPNERGCIIWPYGKYGRKGYGCVNVGQQRQTTAHKLALEIKLGRKLGPYMFACHNCDTPACFNADHLYEGNAKTNAEDRDNKHRRVAAKGVCHPLSKLEDGDIRAIRQHYQSGFTQVAIADMYDISNGTVSRIVRREAWAHVL